MMGKTRDAQLSPGVKNCDTCAWRKSRWENATYSHYCLHPRNIGPMGGAKGVYDARKADGACGPSADLHSSRGLSVAIDFGRQ